MQRLVVACSLILALSPTVHAATTPHSQHAKQSPLALLRGMVRSIKRLDYQGIFVYQNGDALSTLKVVHAWRSGHVRERLVSQDGSRREVLIDGNSVTYVRPSVKSIVIMQRSVHPGLPGGLVAGSWDSPYYLPRLGKLHRVAGMQCRQVVLKPIDQLRYARRICVGLRNDLPLETEVVDRHGKVIERMLFTSIQVMKSIPAREFQPPKLGSGYTLKRLRNTAPKHTANWRFKNLPTGFRLYAARERNQANGGHPVHQLVLSDGISTVSVFIAPAMGTDPPHGHFLRSGALNVYSCRVHGHAVTVMGEVPKRTVKSIAEALTFRANSPS